MVKTEKEEIIGLKKRVTAIEKFIEKDGLSKNGRLIYCGHINKKTGKPCDHSFVTRSKMNSTSCTKCGNKIKLN